MLAGGPAFQQPGRRAGVQRLLQQPVFLQMLGLRQDGDARYPSNDGCSSVTSQQGHAVCERPMFDGYLGRGGLDPNERLLLLPR